MNRTGLLIPREHGAWAMLVLPFLSALAVAGRASWEVLPAAVAVVGVFLVREPLVVLWRGFGELRAAWRSLAWFGPLVLASGAVLLWRVPAIPLVALGLAAGGLLAVSTWLVVHNRRRSVLLQVSSVAGLNASAVVAWLAVRPALEAPLGWLWALQFAHSTAAVLAVHARLEARIAARGSRELVEMRRQAVVAQALLLAAAVVVAGLGRWWVAGALGFSVVVHAADLWRLRQSSFVETPLTRVGLRELAISTLYSALLVVGLR